MLRSVFKFEPNKRASKTQQNENIMCGTWEERAWERWLLAADAMCYFDGSGLGCAWTVCSRTFRWLEAAFCRSVRARSTEQTARNKRAHKWAEIKWKYWKKCDLEVRFWGFGRLFRDGWSVNRKWRVENLNFSLKRGENPTGSAWKKWFFACYFDTDLDIQRVGSSISAAQNTTTTALDHQGIESVCYDTTFWPAVRVPALADDDG